MQHNGLSAIRRCRGLDSDKPALAEIRQARENHEPREFVSNLFMFSWMISLKIPNSNNNIVWQSSRIFQSWSPVGLENPRPKTVGMLSVFT